MRLSQRRTLLEVERQLRGGRSTWSQRAHQLKLLTSALAAAWFCMTVAMWYHPRPVRHVWIDEVLVEVVEETWGDAMRGWVLYAACASGALLVLLHAAAGASPPPAPLSSASATRLHATSADSSHHSSTGGASSLRRDVSTIAVPSWARRSAAAAAAAAMAGGGIEKHSGLASAAEGAARALGATRPMRTEADLDWFLVCEAARQQQQRRSAADAAALLRLRSGADGGSSASAASPVAGPVGAAAEREVISVLYEGTSPAPLASRAGAMPSAMTMAGSAYAAPSSHTAAPPSAGPAAASSASSTSAIPWADLGVYHLEEALQRTREWISHVCGRLVDNMTQCDRWFAERGIEAYDCQHSLQELLPTPPPAAPTPAAPAAASTLRWGAPLQPAAPPVPVQPETKLLALLREKAYCRQTQQQGMRELDTALRYDQRLTLETQLDVSGTFPSAAATRQSNAELAACRQYVVARLHTFAGQRGLVSYNAGGGDPATWRRGLPCDAHLLLHVLRTSVKGLSEYVRFGYQTGLQTQDLALYVGDTGEPYFYVRLRQYSGGDGGGGGGDVLLSTRQGATSLMEAVLAFAAVVHVCYNDVYGDVRGKVDLRETGLDRVLKESRR